MGTRSATQSAPGKTTNMVTLAFFFLNSYIELDCLHFRKVEAEGESRIERRARLPVWEEDKEDAW